MFITNTEEPSLRYRLLTSALLFGLLAEWIIPWMTKGEFGGMLQLGPLLVVIGCVLGAGLFRPEWYISLLFNGALCVLSLMWLYKSGDETAFDWLSYLPKLLWNDLDHLFAVGLWTMSGEMRTLLLFIGWAMLAPALQALLWMRQLALGFAAITAAYLLLLHTWLGMDVWSSLLRTAVEGLLLGGIVTIARVQRLHGGGRERSGGQTVNWLSISLFIVVLCTGAGILFSGNKPVYQEPAAWTTSLSEQLGQSIMKLTSNDNASAVLARGTEGASTGVTGYGFDDSELGAPLQQSDSVIFTGVSPVRTYWRGESKSDYDGRGWSNEWSDKTLLPVEGYDRSSVMAEEMESAEGQNDWETETEIEMEAVGTKVIQTVVMKKPLQGMPLFASGPSGRVLNLVAADPRRALNTYVSNDFSGALYAPTNKAKIERYTVQSTLPITDEMKLREVSQNLYGASAGTEASSEADAAGLDKYLQLPESLPSRVAALAAEISGGGVTNRYEQVKAVESYLKNNYTYTIADSKVPPQGSDLVDYFLFEQNKGYCVHFSSAMVVLLRTQGIPARWVKGFAPGTPTESTLAAADDALTAYEVSSKDAHAWVEVYFPEIGWVPFDPTPGFDGVEGAATAALAGAALVGADGVDGSAVVGADARPLG
ncbi:MAG: transglutaminase domain-containing protein, partial [Candidatus Pristimantibacillus sp.]